MWVVVVIWVDGTERDGDLSYMLVLALWFLGHVTIPSAKNKLKLWNTVQCTVITWCYLGDAVSRVWHWCWVGKRDGLVPLGQGLLGESLLRAIGQLGQGSCGIRAPGLVRRAQARCGSQVTSPGALRLWGQQRTRIRSGLVRWTLLNSYIEV